MIAINFNHKKSLSEERVQLIAKKILVIMNNRAVSGSYS